MKSLKKYFGVVFALAMVISTLFITGKAKAAAAGFYVNGTTVYDANGNPFVMRGVNIAHAWYKNNTSESIKAAASKGCNCVRIVLADGDVYGKTSADELKSIISECKANKVVAVLDIHDTTGSDDYSKLQNAVKYWGEMKDILNANRKYVIVNIGNEWYGTWDAKGWADGYKKAIKDIRNAGVKNLLMVDCAGWGQYPDSIKYQGSSVAAADPDRNTMFSIHMYEYAGGDASTVKANIDNALNVGVPVCIGEFGCRHTNGDVDEYTIMSYCTEKNVGYMGWSWKGNGSQWAFLDLSNDFGGNSLTEWGNTLFYDTYGIKNTSKTCSIFGGSSQSGSGSGSSGSSSSGSKDYGASGLDGEYYIKNVYSGLYLDVASGKSADGTNVQQWFFNGSRAQKFKLVSDGNGYYYLMTGATGYKKAVDVNDWKADDGTNIQQWSYHGGDCQKFQFVDLESGKYAIKTKVSNCYSGIEVYGWSKNSGGNIGEWKYLDNDNQKWYLEKADSKSSSGSSESGSDKGSSDKGGSDSKGSSSSSGNYVSLFWGKNSASNWGQAVSVMSSKNGGSFDARTISDHTNGYIYVEYSGDKDNAEIILQSWSGGNSWERAKITESGTANGHYYIKADYNSLKNALGSDDFAGKLDQIHAGAKSGSITVYSVCYGY